MPYIWDIIAIVIIAVNIYGGVKRGFVRTIVTTLCYGIALMLVNVLGPKLSVSLYENYLSERISSSIAKQIAIVISDVDLATSRDVLARLPDWLSKIVNASYPEFADQTFNFLEGVIGDDAISRASAELTTAVSGVVIEICSWFFFIVLFLVIVMLLKWIVHLFTAINHIPLVGAVNMVLGGVTGILIGLIIVMILGIVVSLVGVILGNTNELFKPETIKSSFILGTLSKWFMIYSV